MAAHYQILIPLLSIFLVRVDLTDLFPIHLPVKVLKVYDGDTLLVSHGSYKFKLRLDKIDAPEKRQPIFALKKDAGEYAKRCLEKLIKGDQRHVIKIQKEDIYGRILGDLNDANLKLLEKGCATLYPHALFDSKKQKTKYLLALKKAKARRAGLWQYGGFMQPKIWRKISKRNAHPRFHR